MDLANLLKENGVEIDRKKIQLEEPIKALGTYRVPIAVHPDGHSGVESESSKRKLTGGALQKGGYSMGETRGTTHEKF